MAFSETKPITTRAERLMIRFLTARMYGDDKALGQQIGEEIAKMRKETPVKKLRVIKGGKI